MKTTRRDRAFSLAETTLALWIMAFALIPIFGLLPLGLNSNLLSTNQTIAGYIETAVVADLCAASPTSGTTAKFRIPFPTGPAATAAAFCCGDDGTISTGADLKSRYRVSVTLSGTGTPRGRILISWPAQQVNPALAAGAYESFIALNRN